MSAGLCAEAVFASTVQSVHFICVNLKPDLKGRSLQAQLVTSQIVFGACPGPVFCYMSVVLSLEDRGEGDTFCPTGRRFNI